MFKTGRAISALCVLAVGAVAAGFYLVPSHQEIALMQMDDFHFQTAFKNFSTLHREGDSSINVVAPLVNLDIYYGDIDKAIVLLQAYIAAHPHTVEGRKKLAELYKSSQRFDHYCEVLEELQQISPSTKTLRDLADMYAFLGRHRDEMKTLARLIDSSDYVRDEADYYKLASYYRADNQPDEAIGVIRDFVEDNHYRVAPETITLAVQLLLESGREEKAFDMARAYLKKRVNEDDGILLSTLFEDRGDYDSAYTLLTPFLDNMDHSPDLEQQVVDLMLEQKKDDQVYAMLTTQHSKEGSLPPALAVTLIDLAVKRADYTVLEASLRSQDLEKLPGNALLHYADVVYQLKRPDLAHVIESKLSDDYLRDAPALKAILAVAADDTPKTVAALAALPHDTTLTPQAKIIVAGIYMQHNMAKNAFGMLDNISVSEIFDAFDPTQYAQLYLDMGAGDKAEQTLNAVRASSPPEIQNAIDQTLVLLAAGEGKSDFIKAKLAADTGTDMESVNETWPDAYDIAVSFQRNEIALAIADHIYKVEPNAMNQMQLAEALQINHRFADALDQLLPLVETNADAHDMFLDAISDWAQQPNGVKLSRPQKKAFDGIVAEATRNSKMPPEDRRDIAFILEDIGSYDQAENLLVAMAGDQPFASADVQELLGFWDDHSSSSSMSWIESRARRSAKEEKISWLAYLNDNNQSQTVLDLLQDDQNLSPAEADQYIEALVNTNNKAKLEVALDESIESETNIGRLKKLAAVADNEDVDDATEKAWRKVYALNPNDNDAAKELGLIDFDAEHYDEAEKLLKQCLQQEQDDYRVNLAYGEILQQDDRKSDSEPFLKRALQQISDIKEKDEATRQDEAYLLYLTDNITESIAHYRQLLVQYPDDKELRADFAEVLTETGKFDEASALLSR